MKRRKIEFIKNCPACGSELNLDVVNVQCKNKHCPSVVIGNIMNFCNCLRIKNIGYETLKTLVNHDIITDGVVSLFKLKNKSYEIENLPNFGKLKTRAIINSIESKRELFDYEFFGALGIQGLSTKTFQEIFKLVDWTPISGLFLDKKINTTKLNTFAVAISFVNGLGEKKIKALVDYLLDPEEFSKIRKLLKEIKIKASVNSISKPIAVISGFRDQDIIEEIEKLGYEVSDHWTNKASVLYVKKGNSESSKEKMAKEKNIPIAYILRREDVSSH